eukprot:TRINITY_DN7094_c0_g1_i4.p1 TRINITY_DN7094_c0_g1~~TRINITY_DN7094_c0_g1_i4.p1  ORF type:complete len:626 (+),score=184.17 TRINITY_DN7094_c0_g1_i4:1970-3847(+)
MKRCTVLWGSHREALSASLRDPAGFWEEQGAKLVWDKVPKQTLRQDEKADLWFTDGKLNMCYNAVDVNVEKGLGDSPAFRYDSPVSSPGKHVVMTYNEVLKMVNNIAGMLIKRGVQPGDTVLVYMAQTLEAVCTMLACARVGAIHVVCFGGFAPNELAKRIIDAKPKLIVASSCGVPAMGKIVDYKVLLDSALEKCNLATPIPCVVVRRPELFCDLQPGRDIDFYDALGTSPEQADPVMLPSTHPLYIMFTSGTTGQPKGVVRDIGGYATVLKWSMKAVYGLDEKEVMFAASDIGWVVGHSYIVYGPLLAGCQSVVYEGKPVGTPDASAYWRVIEDHKVNSMFAAPTGIRALKRDDPNGELMKPYDLSSLKYLFLAGERTDTDTLDWAQNLTRLPVYDHWWQTESGWPITSPCVGLSEYEHSPGAGLPVPGWNIKVMDLKTNEEIPSGTEMGDILIKRPLPPGMLNSLWGKTQQQYAEKYLTGNNEYYLSGDAGYLDDNGHVFIMSRTDDIMNVGAIRLSTGMLEESLSLHPAIAEGVVVGLHDDFKGVVPVAFYVVKSGTPSSTTHFAEINKLITDNVGGFARLRAAIPLSRLPKTRSGKVLRVTIRKMLNKEKYDMPSTIEVC